MATQEKHEGTGRNSGSSTTPRVGQQARDIAGDVGERATRLGEDIREGVDTFRERFSDVRDTVVDRTKEYARVTDTYVNENPWIAVGIGAGIGFLLGMMLSPKGSNRPYA